MSIAVAATSAIAVGAAMSPATAAAQPLAATLSLDDLPRPSTPPPEVGPVVPAQVERWRREAQALEYGDGVERDPVAAAELYCRAARHGDAVAQFNLAWMLVHPRGIARDDAQAAHLFAAAAEQGMEQAVNMARSMGTPQGAPPPCLRAPDTDLVVAAAPAPGRADRSTGKSGSKPGASPTPASQPAWVALPPPANAPGAIVRFVELVAPEYKLEPLLVLSVMATESNFDAMAASPRGARGLMQLIPDTASRFSVRDPRDPVQNIRGGMAYLRWLLAYFEGDVVLATAAYNAGERAVDRYQGVPPYAETRAYVRRILALTGGQRLHRYDSTVTPPSSMIALLRHSALPR